MSLKLQNDIKKLRKELSAANERITKLESRDESRMIEVMQEAMANYLEAQVEFSVSTEGKIKELIG